MIENQFWWARIEGYDDDEVVEVRVEHGKPLSICFAGSEIGIAADNFEQHGVRLLERVLPAGRAIAEEREACAALVEPKGPCPCDCGGRCYCDNAGDLRDMTDWLTATALAKSIRERVTSP